MNYIKRELEGWRTWEIVCTVIEILIIVGVSISWGDGPMGIISAVCGVMYVILAGKGKLSAYAFGLVNCVLYAIISYKAALYGETMLNVAYYIPMQFIGFFIWKKNMNDDTAEVKKRHMSNKMRVLWLALLITATGAYGAILKYLGDAMPLIDSFTTMGSVIAMIASVWMYSEQWWIWFAVNSVSIYMWACDFASGSDNMATLLMWMVYLINGVVMLVKWEKEIRKNKSIKGYDHG